MQFFSINGFVGSKCEGDNCLSICYLTQNLSQLHLACLSCIGSKNNYVVFNPDPDCESQLLAGMIKYDDLNIRFCFEIDTLLDIIDRFDLLITTVGHLTPAMNKDLRRMIDLARDSGLLIVDVPHGLFQFGHNFWDDSRIISLTSSRYGSGSWLSSFATSRISWFEGGADCPGYPRYNNCVATKSFCIPEYTLITSNSNWYLYGELWQRCFLRFITKYAFKKQNELIIWSPHPAELNHSPIIASYIENLLPPNVFIYGSNSQLKFANVETTEDLIAGCVKGITTISTCLLDYEINKKPVLVLSSDSTSELADSLKQASIIELPNDLGSEALFEKLESGYLFPYDVNIFDSLLAKIFKQ